MNAGRKKTAAATTLWRARADRQSKDSLARICAVLTKLPQAVPLDASEQQWLCNMLLRWMAGEDLRAELFAPVQGRARPRLTERDQKIARLHDFALRNNLNSKRVRGFLAKENNLSDRRVESIVGSMKPYIRRLARENRQLVRSISRDLSSI